MIYAISKGVAEDRGLSSSSSPSLVAGMRDSGSGFDRVATCMTSYARLIGECCDTIELAAGEYEIDCGVLCKPGEFAAFRGEDTVRGVRRGGGDIQFHHARPPV